MGGLVAVHGSGALPAGPVADFLEAMLALVGTLMQTTSGCQVLADAGVLQALLPLLQDCRCVRVGVRVRGCECRCLRSSAGASLGVCV